MPTVYKCHNKACKKMFDRVARYTNHIQLDSKCALHIKNITFLSDNDNTTALVNIHALYYPLTSRTHSEHAYRETRKILKEVHRKEAERAYRDLSERYAISRKLLEVETARADSLQQEMDGLNTEVECLKEENATLQDDNEKLQNKVIHYKDKLKKVRSEQETQMLYENDISDLLGRLYNSMPVKYTYKMSYTDLAPFSIPSATCVSEAEFEKMNRNPDAKPLDIIREYTYTLFSNANENQLVHVKNQREQVLHILQGLGSMGPTSISSQLMGTLVTHILREIREQVVKMQANVARKWDPVMPPEQISMHFRSGMTVAENARLEADRLLVWRGTVLYDYCDKNFIKSHKRKNTKAEAKETKQVCKTTDMIYATIVKALAKLNKEYVARRNESDARIIKRFS